MNPKAANIRSAQVKVKRGNRVYAKGRIVGKMAKGRTTLVKLKVVNRMQAGRYRVVVTAGKAGCRKAVSASDATGASARPASAEGNSGQHQGR